jgi:predicted phosphodiesterase
MPRPGILLARIVILAASALAVVSSGYAQTFSFVSMADSRGSDEGVNDAVLSGIVDLVLQEDVDFVLFPGDLVNGSSNTATLTSQLNHWRDVVAPLYLTDLYGAKVYAGPGNHEIVNSASEGVWQSIFSDLPSNGPAGETYMTYSFDYLNSHFVMLNTDRAGNRHTLNYDWLASDLAATTADHIFVFGHEPAYPVGPHLGSSLDVYPDERDAFWQLLVAHDADIYFAGHEHLYDHQEIERVHQVINGTCGAPIYSGYGGDFYHYVVVSVDGRQVFVTAVDDAGETRDYFEFIRSDCSDGLDNDGDGATDYPDDIGCKSPAWPMENPECSDGIDNDDGDDPALADWDGAGLGPRDPHCAAPWDKSESASRPCGLGAELALLLPPLGWLRRRRSHSSWCCRAGSGGGASREAFT